MKFVVSRSLFIITVGFSFHLAGTITSQEVIPSGWKQTTMLYGDVHDADPDTPGQQLKEKIIPLLKAAEPAAGEKPRPIFYVGVEQHREDPKNGCIRMLVHLLPELQKLNLKNTTIQDIEMRHTMLEALDLLEAPTTCKNTLEMYRTDPELRQFPNSYYLCGLHSTFLKNGVCTFIDELTFQDALDAFEAQCVKIADDIRQLPEKERVYLEKRMESARLRIFESAAHEPGFIPYLKEQGIAMDQKILPFAIESFEKYDGKKTALAEALNRAASFLFEIAIYCKVRMLQRTKVEKIVIFAGEEHTQAVSYMLCEMGFEGRYCYGYKLQESEDINKRGHSLPLDMHYFDLLGKPAYLLNVGGLEEQVLWYNSWKAWVVGFDEDDFIEKLKILLKSLWRFK